MFHSLLGCMELLPGLQAVFAIPNMNALPVHCANQVQFFVFLEPHFVFDFRSSFWRPWRALWGPFSAIWEQFGEHFGSI